MKGPGRTEQWDNPQGGKRRAPVVQRQSAWSLGEAGNKTKSNHIREASGTGEGLKPEPPLPSSEAAPCTEMTRYRGKYWPPTCQSSRPWGSHGITPQSDGPGGWWCLRALPAPNSIPELSPNMGSAFVSLHLCLQFLPLCLPGPTPSLFSRSAASNPLL